MRVLNLTSLILIFISVSDFGWCLTTLSPFKTSSSSKEQITFKPIHGRLFSSFEDDYTGFGDEFEEDDEAEDRLSDEDLAATMGEWDENIARLNTVHLVGRIGQDPEARYLSDGKVVVNLSLACQRKYHNLERKEKKIRSGEEETDWYGLEIWGPQAEFVSKYVDKGARVGVIGSLQIDEWADKETGEPRERAKIIVRDFDVLETKAEADLRRGKRSVGNRKSFAFSDDDEDDTARAGTGDFYTG